MTNKVDELDKKIDKMLSWNINGHTEPVLFQPEMKKAIKKLITQEKTALLERVEREVVNLCDYCDGKGYIEIGGTAMEDDLVEKEPCGECELQRQALQQIKEEISWM